MHRQISLRLKIILSIISLVVMTGLTFTAFCLLSPRTHTTNQTTATSSTPKIENAAKLMEAYEKSTDITGRGAASYTKRTTTSTNTSVFYFNKAKPYNTTFSSPTLVQYQAVDVKQTTNSKELMQTTTKFLQSLDLAMINTRSTTGTTSTLFEGPTVVCQTDDIHIASYLPVTYGLVCIDKTLVDSTYQRYNTLINLAKADISLDSITYITPTVISDDVGTLTLLTAEKSDKTSIVLYYVTADSTSTYVGARTAPSVDGESGAAIPKKLQQAIDTSPNKALLVKYIK